MTPRWVDKRSLSRNLVFAFAAMVVIAGPVLFGLAQVRQTETPTQSTNSGALPSFEVASIKPNHSGGGMIRIDNSPGRFRAINVTPKMLIQFAYSIKGPELSGGPSWIDSERFDIDAKLNDNPDNWSKQRFQETGNRQKLMVQSLLAERFELKLAHQTKDLPVYALVVAKNGPKFQESTTPAPDPAQANDQGPHPGQPGRGRTGIWIRRGELNMTDAPMSALASALSDQLGRRVFDETGLKGNFDLKLQWTPDEAQGAMAMGAAGGPDGRPPGDSALPPDTGPSIFTALEEQLGLKLTSRNRPLDTLVIEHIERPSEN